MNSLKTVAAVLVVLLAFTGFQLIANYSLRKSVVEDVKKQIKQIDSGRAEMLKHQERLREATKLMTKLAGSLEAVSSQVAAAAVKSADLAKSVGELEAKLKALGASLDDLKKKLGALDGAADAMRATRASLQKLRENVGRAETDARTASQAAAGALTALGKLKKELADHKQAVSASALAQMNKEIGRIRGEAQRLAGEVRKLASDLQTIKIKTKDDGV